MPALDFFGTVTLFHINFRPEIISGACLRMSKIPIILKLTGPATQQSYLGNDYTIPVLEQKIILLKLLLASCGGPIIIIIKLSQLLFCVAPTEKPHRQIVLLNFVNQQ